VLQVGGTAGTAQITAQDSATPSISLLKTSVVEYFLSVDGNNYLNIGYPSAPIYHYSDGSLTLGGNSATFNSGVKLGVVHASNPMRAIVKSGVVEFDETINGDNQWELSANSHAIVLDIGGGAFFGPGADNDISLGSSSNRFKEAFLATATINTSGAATKANIRALSDAEIAVARNLAANVRLYQFCDAVEKKGTDKARFHIGHIYEDVVAAFAAEGLDPMRYGIVCRDPAVKTVQKTRTVQRPKLIEKTMVDEAVSVNAGVATLSKTTVTRMVPAVTEYPVVDANGVAVMDGDKPRIHREPVLETVEETYSASEADTNEDGTPKYIVGLRYSELALLIIAGLIAQIGAG
jgi:hypothetical protein